MAVAAEAIVAPVSESQPYVGLRPFEAHQRDRFFGRARDAQILCDRILSGRLTILYAQSGLGKSSLLRALVIPQLEESRARVVYFDTWGQQNPLHALKDTLGKLAESLGVPGTNHRSLTLSELARLLASVDNGGVVLVFDQFEEFLVRHAKNLDPLRSELAALVGTAKLDVMVVLALREEFLAALEPFRSQILNLFQSAYRLEALSKEDLAKAIRQPAELFGGHCEKALADELIQDLKGSESEPSAEGASSFVGLPMLQLVCQELWKRAPDGHLTLALYESLGREKRIINDYVRGLMPKGRKEQDVTAHLLVHLAPPSGLKMSYSVDDLASTTGLAAAAIESELKRLEGARILRTREYRTSLRYELEHDAFIPVLGTWRKNVLERSRRRKLMWRMVGAAAVALTIVSALGYGLISSEREQKQRAAVQSGNLQRALEKQRDQKDREALRADMALKELQAQQAEHAKQDAEVAGRKLEDWQTGGLLGELEHDPQKESLASSRLDVLTSYLLLERSGEQRLALLKERLQDYQDLIPSDYAEPVTHEAEGGSDSPLKLEYAKARNIDTAHFMIVWRSFATEISLMGIPVPLQVQFLTVEAPKDKVRVIATGMAPVELDLPLDEDQYLVRYPVERLDESGAKEFLIRFRADWKKFPSTEWLLVPKWSLPVWKLAKQKTKAGTAGVSATEIATSPSGITAYRLLLQLEKDNLKVFFSERAAGFLLHNVPERYRATLDEAMAARGTCLVSDVAGKLRETENAFALPQILDEVADQRCETAEVKRAPGGGSTPGDVKGSAAKGSIGDAVGKTPLPKSVVAGDGRMLGPWPQQSHGMEELSKADYQAFSDLNVDFRRYDSPIHVYVGSALAVPKDQSWNDLREEVYRKYGVIGAVPQFSNDSADPPGAHAIRTEILADPLQNADLFSSVNRTREVKGDDRGALMAAIQPFYEETRALWITADTVQELLNHLPPKTQNWLLERYSITDLKKLLRMVLLSAPAGQGASIRYTGWLIDSLCFWAVAERDAKNGTALRDDLRRLQEDRVSHHAAEIRPGMDESAIDGGISALLAGDPVSAATQFETALRQDRKSAEEAFRDRWRRRLPEVWLTDHRQDFSSLRDLKIGGYEQIDLRDLPGGSDPRVSREIAIDRLAAGVADARSETATVRSLLDDYGSAADWPAEQARWLAVNFMKQYDPTDARTGDQREFDSAKVLIKSAITRLDQAGAVDAFGDIAKLAVARPEIPIVGSSNRPIPNWCWRLLTELEESRPGGAPRNLQLELAWNLADEERSEPLRKALVLADGFESILRATQLSAEERQQQMEFVDYIRAKAGRGLQVQGDAGRADEAERLFRKLLDSKVEGVAPESYRELAHMLIERGGDGKIQAHALLQEAEKKWPDDSSNTATEMFLRLQDGDVAAVSKIAGMAEKKADEQKKLGKEDSAISWLFHASTGLMITQSGDWRNLAVRLIDQGKTFDLRDYHLMTFYAHCPGRGSDAEKLLKERWGEIKPEKWDELLTNGDTQAWREMLVWGFKDEAHAKKLLETLEDEEKWKASKLSQLPISLRGQRCEAWFYAAMRAKASGQPDTVRQCLRKCVAAGMKEYYEHAMAVFLLRQMGERFN